MNAQATGWVRAMGLTLIRATADEVACRFEVDERHLQGYGIVHGGVHCGVVETLASIGATLWGLDRGLGVAGLENSTSFLRATRAGTVLTAVARPVTRGRRSQVWQVEITDQRDRPVATGRVRLICLEAGAQLAGQPLEQVSPLH